jgi:sulfur relay (sulfurtransferase) DsrC/TusE family protein
MKPTTRSLIKYRGEDCLNCATPLDVEDKYCHQCGQLNSKKRLALKDFFGEFFSNIFSYDSRIWRTIKHLLFKPGYVSKQFIGGKRLNYANPFRFFLSVSIVFFLMIQAQELVHIFTDNQIEKTIVNVRNDATDPAIKNRLESVKVSEKDIDKLTEKELKEIEQNSYAGGYDAEKEREYGVEIKQQQDFILTGKATDSFTSIDRDKKETVIESFTQAEMDSLSTLKSFFKQIEYYQTFYTAHKITNPEKALVKMKHDNSRYNQAFYEKMVSLDRIGRDPSILIDIVLPKLPVFLFLFTPILTLFLWLLYARRQFTYMEHLVFAFNVFTFIFLSMIIIFLIKWITSIHLKKFFFLFIGPFYLYKSMRNFYNQGRLKTILKFLSVSFIFVVGLLIGVSFLLLIGIALY